MTPAAIHAAAFGTEKAHGWGPSDFDKIADDPTLILIQQQQCYALARLLGDEAELLLVGTAPTARRKGLAGCVLRQLHTVLATSGATHIFLEVAANNAGAIKLYTTLGYAEIARRKGYYRQSKAAVDALIMERLLNAQMTGD